MVYLLFLEKENNLWQCLHIIQLTAKNSDFLYKSEIQIGALMLTKLGICRD